VIFALIINNQIEQTRRSLPDRAQRLDTGDWVLGLASADPETVAACGWLPVVVDPKPEHDEDTERVERVVTVGDVEVRHGWRVIDLAAGELADRAAQAADEAERDAARRAFDTLGEFLEINGPTAQETVMAVRLMARVMRRMIRDQYQ